jgi:hypothetical protein
MVKKLMDELFKVNQFNVRDLESSDSLGFITDKDKFIAAKQILFGLALLYIITIVAYLYKPEDGIKLLDICTTTFPPLATLILVFYFRQSNN